MHNERPPAMFRKPGDPPPPSGPQNPFGTQQSNSPLLQGTLSGSPTLQGSPNPFTVQSSQPPSVFGAPFQQVSSSSAAMPTPAPTAFGQSLAFGGKLEGQTLFGGFGAPKPLSLPSAPSVPSQTTPGSSSFGQTHSSGGKQEFQVGRTASSSGSAPLFGDPTQKSFFTNVEPVVRSEPTTAPLFCGQGSRVGTFGSQQEASTTSLFGSSSQPQQGGFISLLSKPEASPPPAFGSASRKQSIFGNTSGMPGTVMATFQGSGPSYQQSIFGSHPTSHAASSTPGFDNTAITHKHDIFSSTTLASKPEAGTSPLFGRSGTLQPSTFGGGLPDASKQEAACAQAFGAKTTAQQQQSIFAKTISDTAVFSGATPGVEPNVTRAAHGFEGKLTTKGAEALNASPLFPIQSYFTSGPQLPSVQKEPPKPSAEEVSTSSIERGGESASEGSRKKKEGHTSQSLLSRALAGVVERRKGEESKVMASLEAISTLTTLKCNNVPPELNDRETLLEHFTQFGPVERITCQSRRNCATVRFRDHHSAELAKKRGTRLSKLFPPLEIFWCSRRKLSSDGSSEEPRASIEHEKEEVSITEPRILERPEGSSTKRPSLLRRASGSSRSSLLLSRLSKPRVASAKAIRQRKAKPSEEKTDVELTQAGPGAQDEAHLLAILKQTAHTVGERYRALDARDKIIRLHLQKQSDIVTARATRGCCPDMCPEKERYSRADKKCLSLFEVLPGSDGVMDPTRMVKEYSRSSADQEEPLPHELRPPAILSLTMDYLMACIMNMQENVTIGDWYDFIWNRTRAIRKDITQQHLCDLTSVSLVEKCARFHIHCGAVLVEEDISTFDSKINDENLGKCLQTLKHMYYDLSLRGEHCPNEPEFRAYDVLLHLNEGDVVWQVQQLPEGVRRSREVSLAVAASEALNCQNYVRFFRIVTQAPYLCSCLLHRYFAQVRTQAFQTLFKACRQTGQKEEIPLATLVQQLGFDDASEARDLATCLGLAADDQAFFLIRSSQSQMDRAPLREGTGDAAYSGRRSWLQKARSKVLVENKRTCSVGEVVNGGPLPPNPCNNYQPHDSFMADGMLRPVAYDAGDQAAKCWGKPSAEPSLQVPEQTAKVPTVMVNQPAIVTQPAPTYSNEVIKDVARDIINEAIVDHASSLCRGEVLTQWSQNVLAVLLDEAAVILTGDVCRETYLSAKELRLQEILLAKQQAREDERRSQAIIAEELNVEVVKELLYKVSRLCYTDAMEELWCRRSKVVLETLLKDVLTSELQDAAAVTVGIEKARYEESLSKALVLNNMRLLRSCFKRWLEYRTEQKALQLARETFPSVPNLNFDLRDPELGLSMKRPRVAQEAYDSATKCLDVAVMLRTLKDELEWTSMNVPRLLASIRHKFEFPFKLLVSLPVEAHTVFNEASAKVMSKLGFNNWPPFGNGEKVARIVSSDDLSIPFCITAIEQCPADGDTDHMGRPKVLLGTSAVLFIVSARMQENSSRRLKELLCSLSVLDPAPPFCLLDVSQLDGYRNTTLETTSKALGLDALRQEGLLPDKFCIIPSDMWCQHTLGQMMEDAVKWCARSLSEVPGLCTDYLKDFIEKGIVQFVFDVVYGDLLALQGNPKFPSLVVELYNAALQHLAAVVASKSLARLTVAAPELNVPRYSDHWNDPLHLLQMRDVLLSLRLPPIDGDPDDVNTVWKYVNSLFSTTGSGGDYVILATSITEALKQHHGMYMKRQVPWADIIHDCFCHLLLSKSFDDKMTGKEYIAHYLQHELDSFETPSFWHDALHWASPVRRAVRHERVSDSVETEPMEAETTALAGNAEPAEAPGAATTDDAILNKLEALLQKQKAESMFFTTHLEDLVCDGSLLEGSYAVSTPSLERCSWNTTAGHEGLLSVSSFHDLADAVDALNARIESNRKLNQSLHKVLDLTLKS